MTLSFFATDKLAASYVKEIGGKDIKAATLQFRRVFPDALAEFVRIARVIQDVLVKRVP